MSWSSEDEQFEKVKQPKGRSRSQTREVNEGSQVPTSVVAGLAAVGLTIFGIGVRYLLKQNAPPEPKKKKAAQRKKPPPRRPRSAASSKQGSPTSSLTSTPTKAGFASPSTSQSGPAVAKRSVPRMAPVPEAAKADEEPTPREGTSSTAAAVAATTAAAAAAATAVAAPAIKKAAAAQKPSPSPERKQLEAEAAAAVKHAETAAHQGNAEQVIEAAEELEDVVDDQIQATKEEAVEAIVATVSAAAAAEEAAADADAALAEASKSSKQKEEAAKAKETKAPVVEQQKSEKPAAAAAKKTEQPKKKASPTPATAAAAGAALNGAAAAAAAKKAEPTKPKEEPTPPAPTAAQADDDDEPPELELVEVEEGAEDDGAVRMVSQVPDEADDAVESLSDYPPAELHLDGVVAVADDSPANSTEAKIRDMSLHAVKLAKEGKIPQAVKELKSALDITTAKDSGVRPALIAGCAFTLADMLVALRQIDEAKQTLSTAFAAAQYIEDKGAPIRALTTYGYIVRNEGKPRSAYAAYSEAVRIAKDEYGIVHPRIEQVEMEMAAHLTKVGRASDSADYLLASVDVLLAEAERLDKELPEPDKAAEDKKKSEKKGGNELETGLEHVGGGVQQTEDGETQEDTPLNKQARHYAFRKLINAAGILDAAKRHEEAEKALIKGLELAAIVHGEGSIPVMNTMYALGTHYQTTGDIPKALEKHEEALQLMDNNIEVYEPDMLQNRVALLRDLARLCDAVDEHEAASQYAEGAAVNAQLLVNVLAQAGAAPKSQFGNMLEPFYTTLAEMRAKAGDQEGAAEARREALKCKMQSGMANRGGRQGSMQRSGTRKRSTQGGQATGRAGGRRV